MTNSPLDKWNKVQQYQNDGGKKSNGSWSKENHLSNSTEGVLWYRPLRSPWLMVDDLIADKSRMNREVYRAVLWSDSAKCSKTDQTA